MCRVEESEEWRGKGREVGGSKKRQTCLLVAASPSHGL